MNEKRLLPIVVLAITCLAARAQEKPNNLPPGTVALPLSEYDKLLDLSEKRAKPPEPPPAPWVIASADARIKVTDDQARGTLTITGEVFRKGPTDVPLVTASTLLGARLANRALPLWNHDGMCAAVIDGPSPFTVELDWATAVTAEPGRASFMLQPPAASSVRVRVELPVETADVHLEPGLITAKSLAAGKTTVEATLEGGKQTRVWWSTHEAVATAAERPGRYLSDVKTLITIGDGQIGMAALVDLTVLQGGPSRFEIRLPDGYEVTGASGSTIDTTEEKAGLLALLVREPSRPRHQFLVSLERTTDGGSLQTEMLLPVVVGSQRETGEAAVEGVGTMELTATAGEDTQRMDVREAADALKGMARQPIAAAFRYQRKGEEPPRLKLDVKRYPDAPVLAAAAEHATVTTLVTSQGRMLHEVSLTVRNQAQPFLRVRLPEGASLLSAEVAGAAVKPVKGQDGTRVPLLRPGFRVDGPYVVSYVYMQPGSPLGDKGAADLALPPMDIPVTVLEWELFVPEQYKLKGFTGNAIEATASLGGVLETPAAISAAPAEMPPLMPAQPYGNAATLTIVVADAEGGVLPGVTVTASTQVRTHSATTDVRGVATLNIPAGVYDLTAELDGFSPFAQKLTQLSPGGSYSMRVTMRATSVAETATVVAEQPVLDRRKTGTGTSFSSEPLVSGSGVRSSSAPLSTSEGKAGGLPGPSSNVLNLQRRISGVLPIRVEIPKTGISYHFVRPLVLDEATTVRFEYKKR